jgi:hypothetical protein
VLTESGHRARTNVIASAIVVMIALAGALLFANFLHSVAVMECATAGRPECETR